MNITQQHIDVWNEKVIAVFDIIEIFEIFFTEAQEYASKRVSARAGNDLMN